MDPLPRTCGSEDFSPWSMVMVGTSSKDQVAGTPLPWHVNMAEIRAGDPITTATNWEPVFQVHRGRMADFSHHPN